MRKDELVIGREYALKWDLGQRGQLPMAVVRVKLLGRKEFEIKKRSDYHSWMEKVNGYEVEVLADPLPDPRWSGYARNAEYRISFSQRQPLTIGARIKVENGRDFVAPWEQYASERHVIDSAKAEKEATEWETENRSRQIAERFEALGFTVSQSGLPHQKGYVANADYVIDTKRVSLDALARLLDLAEGARP
jgi:hypothetical protein